MDEPSNNTISTSQNITYALRILCSELFIALETPLSPPISSASSSQVISSPPSLFISWTLTKKLGGGVPDGD